MRERTERRLAGGLVALTAASAVIAGATSGWLTARYRPSVEQVWDAAAHPTGPQRATEVNQAALGLLGGLALLAVLVVVVPAVRRRYDLTWLSVAGASGALVGALVAGMTRPMLEWDQLALWAVTVGGNLEGYWSAAADEAVRFVIVDGTEVAPSTYTAVLGLHLGALIVALAGVALVAADLRRRPGDRGAQNRRSVVDSIPRSSS